MESFLVLVQHQPFQFYSVLWHNGETISTKFRRRTCHSKISTNDESYCKGSAVARSVILTWKWILEYRDQLWNRVETRECRQQWHRWKFLQYLHLHLRQKNTYSICKSTATAEEAMWRPRRRWWFATHLTRILRKPCSRLAERGRQIDRYWPDHHCTEVTGTQERHRRNDCIVVKTCNFRGQVHHYCEHRLGDSCNLTWDSSTEVYTMATAEDSQWNLLTSTLTNAWTLFNCSTERQWWRLWRNRRVWICTMRRQRVIKFNTHCSEQLSENCSTLLEWDHIWCSRKNACHTNLRHQHLHIWHVTRKCWDIWKEHESWISFWRYLHWNQMTWTRPWNTSRDILTLTGLVIQWRGKAHLAHCVTLINFSWRLKCRGQGTVALSNGESDMHALGALSAELIFALSVLKEIELSFLIHARADSSTARAVAKKQGANLKMKHIHTTFLFIQDLEFRKFFTMS